MLLITVVVSTIPHLEPGQTHTCFDQQNGANGTLPLPDPYLSSAASPVVSVSQGIGPLHLSHQMVETDLLVECPSCLFLA